MVSPRTLYFLAAAALLLIFLTVTAGRYYLRARRSHQATWESLLKRLTFVDRQAIAEIALDVVNPWGGQRRDENSAILGSSEIWKLIGGWDGIEALEANCIVLIDLAFYVQQWYPEKALVVAEQLRLSAREIEWHVQRLKAAEKAGKLETSILMNAQRAAVTYFLMTRHVLSLYEQGNLPMLPDLQQSL
jgi:hypothetical protein